MPIFHSLSKPARSAQGLRFRPRAWAAAGLSIAMIAGVSTANATRDVIVLEATGRQALKVERDAPGVTGPAWELAKSIKGLDQRLESSVRISQGDDPELEAATRAAVRELRDESLESLQLALDVQARTSGSLDSTLMSSASNSAAKAAAVLKDPPSMARVSTEISTSREGTYLQYVSAGELRLHRGTWQSYNMGLKLRIGVYQFRVCASSDGAELYSEPVEVFDEPTKLFLNVPKKS